MSPGRSASAGGRHRRMLAPVCNNDEVRPPAPRNIANLGVLAHRDAHFAADKARKGQTWSKLHPATRIRPRASGESPTERTFGTRIAAGLTLPLRGTAARGGGGGRLGR